MDAVSESTPRIDVLTVSPGDEDCEHPPEQVDYQDDDGTNLYFRCDRCGASLIAEDAIHLLE